MAFFSQICQSEGGPTPKNLPNWLGCQVPHHAGRWGSVMVQSPRFPLVSLKKAVLKLLNPYFWGEVRCWGVLQDGKRPSSRYHCSAIYTCMNVHQHLYMIYVYICIYLYRHVCPYWAFESDLASFISLSIRLNTDVVGLICRAKAREWGWEFGRSSKHLISLHIYFIRIRHFRDLLDSRYLWIFDGSCHFRHFLPT